MFGGHHPFEKPLEPAVCFRPHTPFPFPFVQPYPATPRTCGNLGAERHKQFLIELAKVVILLRTFRSMYLLERIMGIEHELHVALLGSDKLFSRCHCQDSSPPSLPRGTWREDPCCRDGPWAPLVIR